MNIYPRLTTTVMATDHLIGAYPSLRYSVLSLLYQSADEVEALLPKPPVNVIQEQQHRHVAKPLDDLVGRLRYADTRRPDEITAIMRGIGEWIAENVLPHTLICCCHANGLPKTVEIITAQQGIPWELTWIADDFLARKVVHSRYPFVSRVRHKRLAYGVPPTMAIIVGKSHGIFLAESEIEGIIALYRKSFGGDVKVVQGEAATVDLIRDILSGVAGPYDIIHYIGHGDAQADQVWLELVGAPFLGDNIPPSIHGNPIVFWNCCCSGAANRCRYQSDVLDGFGSRLLSNGAGHFIGPLFPVIDTTATAFALSFYESLFKGEPVGLAFFDAKACVTKYDPVALTYVLYGNPIVSVVNHA